MAEEIERKFKEIQAKYKKQDEALNQAMADEQKVIEQQKIAIKQKFQNDIADDSESNIFAINRLVQSAMNSVPKNVLLIENLMDSDKKLDSISKPQDFILRDSTSPSNRLNDIEGQIFDKKSQIRALERDIQFLEDEKREILKEL